MKKYDYTLRKCSAVGCTQMIESKILMCRPHWRKVPRLIQTEIWKQYDPFAEKQKAEYLFAVRNAIGCVAKKEGLLNEASL